MSSSAPASGGLDRLRPLFETALDAVVAMRPDGTVAEWNRIAQDTFGWTRQEAIGTAMSDLIVPPQHRAAHSRGIEHYNRTGVGPVLGQRLEITAVDREGREFPIELSITETRTFGEQIFVGFLRDISERKRSEQLLVHQARKAELLFLVSAIAAEHDALEPVLEATLRAICELAGWPVGHALIASPGDAEELVSSGIWFPAADESIKPLREATAGIKFIKGVGLPGAILESGGPEWFSDTENESSFVRKGLGYGAAFGFPLKVSGRITAALEFFTHDKTPPDPELLLTVRTLGEQVARVIERRRAMLELRSLNHTLEQRVLERSRELETAHEALRQSQKMEAIGQLTGGIAHDFNNFLTVIRGSADLLRRPDLSEEKRVRYVGAIADSADRAARLTGQLLAFARRQALKPEVFDVADRIAGISDMLRTILGSRVQLVIHDEAGSFINADAAQFETALVNLVVNARDAMEGEGELTIEVGSGGTRDMVTVAVIDSGQGIAADDLARIFEPFYTTKEVGKGTGLGLSQVYGFMKQSDGDVAVESQLGAGTKFVLSFPRAPAETVRGEVRSEMLASQACEARILLVEDNADVGEFASQLLGDLGFKTTLASNGTEALEHLRADPGAFDLVFSDVVMPGIGGLELGRKVREQWPGLPVVITSGYSHVLAEDGAHGFPLLHKPYSAEALLRIVQETVSDKRS